MKIHCSASILPLLLLQTSTSRSEAKLGAPPSADDNDTDLLPSAATRRNLGLAPSSCAEHPGEFRYYTSTNGTPLTSCFKTAVQLSRGTINSRQVANRCDQRLVGLDDRYGAGGTVADACPLICGRPCPDGSDGSDGTQGGVSDGNLSSPDVPDGEIRFPENSDSNEDIAAIPSVAEIPKIIQEQVVEEKPTPTIASFGELFFTGTL